MPSTTSTFFETQTTRSRVKAQIVSEYFLAWAKVLSKSVRARGEVLQFIDLFSGPGSYDDGAKSTPILIVETALQNRLYDLVHCRFNDADPDKAEALQRAIANIRGVHHMAFPPQVSCQLVDREITKLLEDTNLPPTLAFIDPFGYKGLTNRLIQAVLKHHGSEVIFFFNHNRVKAGIDNDRVEQHMREFFEVEDTASLRSRLAGLTPSQRDAKVMALVAETLKERGHAKYVRHFTFFNDSGKRISHRIVFATKNALGARLMKAVMVKASAGVFNGVPSYSAGGPKPVDILAEQNRVAMLDELKRLIHASFAGRKIRLDQIHELHGLERDETESNYLEAIKSLEVEGLVTRGEKPAGVRSDHVRIMFHQTPVSLDLRTARPLAPKKDVQRTFWDTGE